MNVRNIGILVQKDLSLFFRKKGIAAVTILGIVFFLVIYFILPSTVDENLKIGLYAPVTLPAFTQMQEEGLEITVVESDAALKEGVVEGDYIVGIALPADIMERFNAGEKPRVNLYFTPDAPQEIKDAMEVLIRELAYMQTGQTLAIDVSEEILGPDMTGTPVPPRDRLRPLLAVFIIMMEILGLANLISEEVERRTAQALLITPATVVDLFVAKGISGIGLAFVQAVLFMAIVGGMNVQPLIILVALLLGAAIVTGISFLIAARAKDFMSVLSWSVPALIILLVPSFGVLFPGAITGWVKVIPSYYLVDTIHRAANFGSGWGDIWLNLVILFGFILVINWAGILVLRRKLLQ
jgi:ABC-2 type transport system permease protein